MSEPPYEAFNEFMNLVNNGIDELCEKPHHEILILSCLMMALLAKRNINAEKFFEHISAVDRDLRKSQKQVDALINNLKRGNTND
jgi:hypothetical protein